MHTIPLRGLATIATLGVAASLTLSACGSNSDDGAGGAGGADIKLAGVLANTSDPFWASIVCGAQGEAKKRGVNLTMYTSTSTDDNEMASNFQTATLKKPDGILVNPFNGQQFVAQYKQLMQDGVPVVTATGTEPRTEYQVVFSDYNTAPFAEEAAAVIPKGSGSMLFMGGAPGIPPLEGRTKPFLEALTEARPDLTKLDDEYSGFDTNKATTDAASTIIAHKDLKVIVAATGPDAIGAAAAVKQAGKQDDISVIGFDAVPPEVQALKDGTIDILIAQNPFAIGREQVAALVDYLKGNPTKPVPTDAKPKSIPSKVLTADNVDAPENSDYVYKATC